MESVRLERDSDHVIYRTSNGDIVCGASTIAGINKPVGPLMGWAAKMAKDGKDYRKYTSHTADLGSITHFLVQCHLTGKEPDLTEFTAEEISAATVAYDKFLEFWEQNKMEVVAVEEQLVSDKYLYGGTLDLVAFSHKTQERMLWDWKTSKAIYESHLFQVAGYFQLWNENHPKEQLERAAIGRIGREKNDSFQIKWIPPKKMPKYWECFRARLGVYYADKALH